MMRDEIVVRRGWISAEEFVDMLGAVNLIPGPNSTEMAIHIGQRRGGWIGLIVAGACFILPATFIVTAVAWAYVTFGTRPQAIGVLLGVKPVVVAIVAQAIYKLAGTALKTRALAAATILTAALTLLGVNELLLLFAMGASFALWRAYSLRPRGTPRLTALLPALLTGLSGGGAAAGAAQVAMGPLFLVFLKAGAVLFGSGYVLLAFLRADLVERLHWVTEGQLLDAIAIGQVTPGPVFTTATFIGYVLAGGRGAAVATIGIFLPAFVFVALSGLLLPRLRRSRIASAFLDAVNAASLGLMAAVTFELGRSALTGWFPAVLFGLSALALFRTRLNTTWLVLGGAVAGIVAGWIWS